MAVLLLGLGLFALALPACIALPAQGSEAGDGPAMRLRGAGDEAAGGGAPRFFNPETMRVTTEDETLTMGYAAFIPQRPDSYSAADDESLPLAHRLNAGLALPNIYAPKEYAPLRALLGGFADSPLVRTILGTREEPEQEEDSNGNLLSVRSHYQPVSWLTVMKALGYPGRVKRIGDHMLEDPLTAHYNSGLNALPSPTMIPTFFLWTTALMLPFNWIKHPYSPWSPLRPWKLSFDKLPARQNWLSVGSWVYSSILRQTPSSRHPWWRLATPKNNVLVYAPSERDRDICCSWPIYKHGAGSAVVDYPEPGAYLLLAGSATLSLDGQDTEVAAGDLVRIPEQVQVVWTVREGLMMHYTFGY